MVWLWIAITLAGASHTAHLWGGERERQLNSSVFINILLYNTNWLKNNRYNNASTTEETQAVCLPADIPGQWISKNQLLVCRLRRVRRQPIGVIISRSVATSVVMITDQERHGGEPWQTASQSSFKHKSNQIVKIWISMLRFVVCKCVHLHYVYSFESCRMNVLSVFHT